MTWLHFHSHPHLIIQFSIIHYQAATSLLPLSSLQTLPSLPSRTPLGRSALASPLNHDYGAVTFTAPVPPEAAGVGTTGSNGLANCRYPSTNVYGAGSM